MSHKNSPKVESFKNSILKQLNVNFTWFFEKKNVCRSKPDMKLGR